MSPHSDQVDSVKTCKGELLPAWTQEQMTLYKNEAHLASLSFLA